MTSPRERAQLNTQLRQQQEALVRDLLPVLDALDRAEAHWQRSLETPAAAGADRPPEAWPRPWRWLRRQLQGWLQRWLAVPPAPAAASGTLARDAGEGIRLIRGDLVDALRRHGLEPIDSSGDAIRPGADASPRTDIRPPRH